MNDWLSALLLSALLLAPGLARAQGDVKIEKTNYKGWPNCYRMTNGQIELVVTSDIGPRIIRFAFVGGENMMKEFAGQIGKSGEKEWMIRGGHRVWIAPEDRVATYALDNSPIQVRTEKNKLIAIQPTDTAGVQKEMHITMAANGPSVEILHRIRNQKKAAMDFAPWVLTVLAQGGRAIIPFPPRGEHPKMLDPTNPLVMWAYTDFRDKRWTLGFKYISLRQDAKVKAPQKIGTLVPDGWAAYLNFGNLMVKRFSTTKGGNYPDFGSNVETFTNDEFIELETLGTLARVAPGQALEHTERWYLYKGVKLDSMDDASIDRVVLPKVKESR